jgi:hypothetical protein
LKFDIWDIKESDFIRLKGAEIRTAPQGTKFLTLNVTAAKTKETPGGTRRTFRFEINDPLYTIEGSYPEYIPYWLVDGYLDKEIINKQVGESENGLLIFEIPKSLKNVPIICYGCVTSPGFVNIGSYELA